MNSVEFVIGRDTGYLPSGVPESVPIGAVAAPTLSPDELREYLLQRVEFDALVAQAKPRFAVSSRA